MRIFTVTVLTFLPLLGCLPHSVVGPNPTHALLLSRGVEVEEVDGASVSLFASGIQTPGGEHTLTGRVAATGFLGPDGAPVVKTITFRVANGKTYLVKSSSTYRPCIWVEEEVSHEIVSWDNQGCGVLPTVQKIP